MSLKKDFPIFKNNPDLVFFDSTSTTQKPSFVIDGIKHYLENDYSNIHRGMYDIAQNSEKLYKKSKEIIAKFLGISDTKEIIYTYNSTYAINLFTSSLARSKYLKAGDKVLLSIVEHHANIVPWLILKEEIGIEVEFIGITDNYDLDLADFDEKYDDKVKIISLTNVSNVTGQIFNLSEIGRRKREDTLFVVDASQSVPHMRVDVKEINCDVLFFTGHKVMADSGIGVLWGKRDLLNELTPSFSGGGAIGEVTCNSFTSSSLPDKFEPGTPNVTGAVSLLKAFQYIESIGGFKKIEEIEDDLMEYFLERLQGFENIELMGSYKKENRVGVFSLVFNNYHSNDIAEILAEKGIAVRAGKHCAHPLFTKFGYANSLRVSLYIYNTKKDIDKFFDVISNLKNS
ncbi:MAG: cysteine desulfurase [Candidatus Gracilibacteria bacterium]|nr:cysteine desulfurase [Candidatus Gracilibacteria bacterium]